MSDFDWKSIVRTVAPTIATALGGPLAGVAVSQLGAAILGKPDATQDDIAAAIASGSLTGEQIAAMKSAENDFKVKMRELDIDVLKLQQESDKSYVADTSNARSTFGSNESVFVLGVCVLIGFAVIMIVVLTGLFWIMTGRTVIDPGMLTACGTLIGTIVGYVAANAQQVVGFFFGSSKGSKDQSERIAGALTDSIKSVGQISAAVAKP